MSITEFLDKSGVNYKITEHAVVFTAQRMAAEEHEKGKFIAKPVIIKADGKYMMCVLSACCKINFNALKSQLGADMIELADEKEIAKLFPDCSLGAEPPFGNLYDLPTIVDKDLCSDDHITFQAGTHEEAIHMSMADYRELVKPRVLEFSYHMAL